jgi:hypothetical protein
MSSAFFSIFRHPIRATSFPKASVGGAANRASPLETIRDCKVPKSLRYKYSCGSSFPMSELPPFIAVDVMKVNDTRRSIHSSLAPFNGKAGTDSDKHKDKRNEISQTFDVHGISNLLRATRQPERRHHGN